MRYIVVVDHFSTSIFVALRKLAEADSADKFSVLFLTRHPQNYSDISDDLIPIEIIKTDFDNAASLKSILSPFKNSIAAVICRGDKQIQFLRKLAPFLPENILMASPESLEAATNKRLMREAFQAQCPEISPAFVRVHDDSEVTIGQVRSLVPFPVIVKPAGLVSSLLIKKCGNETELKAALSLTFSAIKSVYEREERQDEHEVIIEEYLEGDFYSIDAYILEEERIFFCPPVFYLPAQKIGIDDFFLYKRSLPAELTADDINEANLATGKCLRALGLTYSSAHVELIKTANGWKIIEVGPRLGRFRNTMYKYGYGIDHSLNDILIHLGREPVIPLSLIQYCNAYSIYPDKEGVLNEIKGITKLEDMEGVYSFKIFALPGDKALFAKHGGKALAEFIVARPDKQDFEKLTDFIETEVKPMISIDK